jgi:hypothetical protein
VLLRGLAGPKLRQPGVYPLVDRFRGAGDEGLQHRALVLGAQLLAGLVRRSGFVAEVGSYHGTRAILPGSKHQAIRSFRRSRTQTKKDVYAVHLLWE